VPRKKGSTHTKRQGGTKKSTGEIQPRSHGGTRREKHDTQVLRGKETRKGRLKPKKMRFWVPGASAGRGVRFFGFAHKETHHGGEPMGGKKKAVNAEKELHQQNASTYQDEPKTGPNQSNRRRLKVNPGRRQETPHLSGGAG